MKIIFLTAIAFFFTTVSSSQSPETFHTRLGNPDTVEMKDGRVASETYTTKESYRVSINYSTAQLAESLRILPAKSQLSDVRTDPVVPQDSLKAALDKIVPLADRGKYIGGTFLNTFCFPTNDCAGVQWTYEKVSVYYNSGNGGMRYAELTWKAFTIKRH